MRTSYIQPRMRISRSLLRLLVAIRHRVPNLLHPLLLPLGTRKQLLPNAQPSALTSIEALRAFPASGSKLDQTWAPWWRGVRMAAFLFQRQRCARVLGAAGSRSSRIGGAPYNRCVTNDALSRAFGLWQSWST